jgi:hypothetical protein
VVDSSVSGAADTDTTKMLRIRTLENFISASWLMNAGEPAPAGVVRLLHSLPQGSQNPAHLRFSLTAMLAPPGTRPRVLVRWGTVIVAVAPNLKIPLTPPPPDDVPIPGIRVVSFLATLADAFEETGIRDACSGEFRLGSVKRR